MAKSEDAPDHKENLYRSRKFARGTVMMDAEIREKFGGKQKISVIDLSRAGFRMRCMYHIPSDRTVFLTMPGFESMEAKIAWHDDVFYGCEFKKRLHAAIFDHLMAKFPQLSGRL